MKIVPRDGKTYDVKTASAKDDSYDVWLDGELVASFVLEPDDTRVTLHARAAGKTSRAVILEVAQEFVDRGGGAMRIA